MPGQPWAPPSAPTPGAGPQVLASSGRQGLGPGEGPGRRAPPGGGRRTCGRAGNPGAGGGPPGRARGLAAPSLRAGGRRGGGRAARAAAAYAHRWAAAERSRDLRDSSRHTESPAEQSLEDASAPREELTLLPSTGASSVAAAPRPRSAGNFPSKVILWAGRGGARGPPTSSRSAGAGEVRPVLSRSNVAGRRPRALHRRLVASPEPGACASPGSTRFSPPAA